MWLLEGVEYTHREGDGTMMGDGTKYCIKFEQLTKFILKTFHSLVFFSITVFVQQRLANLAAWQASSRLPPPSTPTHSQNTLIYQQSLHSSILASWQGETMVTSERNPVKVCWHFLAKSMYKLSYTHSVTYLHTITWMGAVPQSPAPAPHWWCTSAAVSPPAPYCVPEGSSLAPLPSAGLREGKQRQTTQGNHEHKAKGAAAGDQETITHEAQWEFKWSCKWDVY